MRSPPMSEHVRLEIASAIVRGRPPEPGEPVPGCGCKACTGLHADHPARVPAWRRADPERATRTDDQRRREWEQLVDEARRVPVLDVTARLGCGEPRGRGREVRVCCPLHDDSDPSLRIDAGRGLWFCDPCGQGGDAIELYMRARQLNFVGAVRKLVA